MSDLKKTATEIRKMIIRAHAKGKASHLGTSFSCVDIMVALYHSVLTIFPDDPCHPGRDRFIMSKGHGASALYTTLASKNLIPQEWIGQYFLDGSNLQGHVDRLASPFIEASAGSLGHGLPIGLGRAYALKLNNSKARVFVLMSDGEIQEGSVWEAANNASRLELDNFVGIIDANKIQSFERTDNIMRIDSFKDKWEAFGWTVKEVDGHNIEDLVQVFKKVPFERKKPSMVIAHTTKGKGVKEFEDKIGWHYWPPKPEDVDKYIKELDEKSVC